MSNFPTGDLSVEFWMKSSDAGNEGTPISYSTGGNEFIVFEYRNFSPYIGAVTTGGTGIAGNDGIWHYWALTWRQADGSLYLYRDGASVYNSNINAGYTFASNGCFMLGEEQDSQCGTFSASQAFLGTLDEVRLSNTVKTPDFIAAQYKSMSDSFVTFN